MVHGGAVHQLRKSNEELQHVDLSSATVHNSICLRWGLVCLQWVAEGEGVGVGVGVRVCVWGVFNPVCAHTQKRRGRMCQQVFARAAQEA